MRLTSTTPPATAAGACNVPQATGPKKSINSASPHVEWVRKACTRMATNVPSITSRTPRKPITHGDMPGFHSRRGASAADGDRKIARTGAASPPAIFNGSAISS